MKPKTRKKIAGWVVICTIVMWPVTQLTIASNEPKFVLGLSWLAITLTAADIWLTTDVRENDD